MHRNTKPTAIASILLMSICQAAAPAGDAQAAGARVDAVGALRAGFIEPPSEARPRAWWHWIDSNVTRDGITKDLEWMKRVGIDGFQLFDVGVGVGYHVADPAIFMTPQWLDLVDHAQREAVRLDLEMTYHAAGGWSQTGGPWVAPEQAMKKLVWRATQLSGPGPAGVVAAPPATTGPFQDVPAAPVLRLPALASSVAERGRAEPPSTDDRPEFYRDAHVFAFPTPPARATLMSAAPEVTSNGGPVDAARLRDGRFGDGARLAQVDGGTSVTTQFPTPVTVDGLTIAMGHHLPAARVEASVDGQSWRLLAELPGENHEWLRAAARTITFEPVTASRFRVLFTAPPPPPTFAALLGIGAPEAYTLSELDWTIGAVNRAEAKAGFELIYSYPDHPTPATAAAIPAGDVIDLTDRLRPDGTLDWQVPAGRWTVLRLGYSLTGMKNHPATEAGRGLEVDKLNPDHVEAYLDGLLGPIARRSADVLGAGGIEYLLLDSWEAGVSNWTQDMLDRFQARRGYDPRPYAPALAGLVVEDGETTDRFLWDWRLTLSEMLADNHNGTIQRYANDRAIGIYAESMGTRMTVMGDGMAMKARAEVPMAEFWYVPPGDPRGELNARYRTDIREAASVANTYGQTLVAVEAFTTLPFHPPWAQGPRELKWTADYYFAEGMNRPVIHSSDHQPLDDFAPGFTLWQFGQFLTRHETWADQAKGFMDYLARVSFMLQQGEHVADVAVFLGEGAPLSVPFWRPDEPGLPAGYDYDYVDAPTVLGTLRVVDGLFVTPGGTRYRVLYVPPRVARMTVGLAERLAELAAAGGTVLAPRPAGSPSLADGADANARIEAIARRAWDGGAIASGLSIGALLARDGIAPDVVFEGGERLKWKHRAGADFDAYFVTNLADDAADISARLRVAGRDVQLWYPETGRMMPANYRPDGAGTRVDFELAAHEAVFVVLAGPAEPGGRQQGQSRRGPVLTVDGPWTVRFEDAGGPAAPMTLVTLSPWQVHADPAIRHYSGTATYTTRFTLDAPPGREAMIELGEVGQIATVTLNGQRLGTDWMPPYRLSAGAALRQGDNILEIAVTNLWANRLIGDAARRPGETVSKSVFRPYTAGTLYSDLTGLGADHPLLPSGLAGPVVITAVVGGQE